MATTTHYCKVTSHYCKVTLHYCKVTSHYYMPTKTLPNLTFKRLFSLRQRTGIIMNRKNL